MEELYCNKCKDYTEHYTTDLSSNPSVVLPGWKCCNVCGDIYEENRKRYIICGPKDNAEVITASAELLMKDATAIIINEEVALKHKLKGIPMNETMGSEYIKDFDYQMIKEVDRMRYSHLTKAEREADIQPIRTEPKIQRNELCHCGSGRKYKKCCLNVTS